MKLREQMESVLSPAKVNGHPLPADFPLPDRMEVGKTPPAVCYAHDVYLDGVKQALCIVADVKEGYVLRYKIGIGHRPVLKCKGLSTELMRGKVQILRKGQ